MRVYYKICVTKTSLNIENCSVYRKTRRRGYHQLETRPFEKFIRNVMDSEKLQPDYRIQIAIPP